MVNKRKITRWIKQKFNKKGQPICLIPNCKNICEKYKTSSNYRNYCKDHSASDMSEHVNWQSLREKALRRDNHKCVNCGDARALIEKTIIRKSPSYIVDIQKYSIRWKKERVKATINNLIVDHIKPIALGGREFSLRNLQTLCYKCNKKKTRQDQKDIAILRRQERVLVKGQKQLSQCQAL